MLVSFTNMSGKARLVFISFQLCLLLCTANAARHECQRPCKSGGRPMTCRYEFVLETYSSMSDSCVNCPFNLTDCFRPGCVPADGRRKTLFLVNRQLPGPSIQVCKGDRIIVDLKNELMIETTSIHWHGQHQKATPFMDGVPFVTQCPIMPSGQFRYDFVAEQVGSQLWHSHSHEQRAEGMFGALVVRAPPREEPWAQLYDRDEHVIVLTDWTRLMGIEAYALGTGTHSDLLPHTILVNGLGRFKPLIRADGTSAHMPTAVFEIEKGLQHRFRLINAGVQNCPMEVSIDNHTMLVISSDGFDVQPVEVDSVRILSGERYDVIVSADQEVDNFWIRTRGRDGSDCSCDKTKAHQVAVLRYKGAPKTEPTAKVGYHLPPVNTTRQINPYNKGIESPDAISIPTLDATVTDDITTLNLDHKFYINYDYVNLDEKKRPFDILRKPNIESFKTAWQLNHINLKMPSFPLLTQPEMIEPGMLCNSETVKNCYKEYCSCTHVLSVKLNSTVELIFIDEGYRKFNHPIHLHGHNFRVVAMEKLGNTTTLEEVQKMDKEGRIRRKLSRAPLKDSIIVPSGGYTVVRFLANNPGYWLLHCHFELHADQGMGLIFKVGEHKDFVKPPANFPKCGNHKRNL